LRPGGAHPALGWRRLGVGERQEYAMSAVEYATQHLAASAATGAAPSDGPNASAESGTAEVARSGPGSAGAGRPKVVVIMPAYNAARTLARTYAELPKDVVDHVIVVDDASRDATVEIAEQLGLNAVVHVQNRGYGGNQKTCYLEALKAGADVVVMLHPDYQYDSTKVPVLIEPILAGRADVVLGSRFLGDGALAGGMPLYKFLANRFLTGVENAAFRIELSELHTGLRAYRRSVLEAIPFVLNSEDFVFDSQIIAQCVYKGFRLDEIAVPTRYFPEASSVNWRRSIVYGLATLRVVGSYLLNRWGLRRDDRFAASLAEVIPAYHWQQIDRARGASGVEALAPIPAVA
jgi:glycosyltransferase involved in cell wall biosynthesis